MSNTAQRIPARHSGGWDRNQEAALSAVLPGTMSISWWPPHVDDRSAPNLGAPPALTPEQRLVDAHSLALRGNVGLGGLKSLVWG